MSFTVLLKFPGYYTVRMTATEYLAIYKYAVYGSVWFLNK